MMAAAAFMMAASAFVVMVMIVVIAMCIRVIFQIVSCQRFRRRICRALHARIDSNASLSQCHLCAGADPAADQSINFRSLQEARQCTVSVAICVYHLRSDDLAVFHVVYLELFGMPEVLKYHTVVICYCDSHLPFSLLTVLFALRRTRATIS